MRFALTTMACAALALAAGCASQPIPEPTDYYAGLTRSVGQAKSLLVISSCAVRDEVGTDVYLTGVSSVRASQMANSSQAYLGSQRLNPAAKPVMLMCAGDKLDPKAKLLFADNADAKSTPGQLPHLFSTGPLTNASGADLHALFQAAYAMPNSAIKKAGETPAPVELTLDAQTLDRLRRASGVRYLWLVSGDSLEVSAGKAIGTAFLTAALTLGMAASMPTGGSSTTVALIDLQDPRILWKKSLGSVANTATTTATNTGGSAPLMQTTSNNNVANISGDQAWAAGLFAPLIPAPVMPASVQTKTAKTKTSPVSP